MTGNPSFETTGGGWMGWQSSLTRTAAGDAPDGGYALQVSQSAGTSYTVDDSPESLGATTAGADYAAAAYVKAASASAVGKVVEIKVRERNPGGTVVKEWRTASKLTTGYAPISVTTTAVASGDSLDVRVSQTGAVAGDRFLVDTLSLAPVVPTSNLIPNASVEATVDGWGGWQSTLARTAVAGAPHGDYAVKVSRATGSSYTIDDVPDTVVSTSAGAKYQATAWLSAASTSAVGKTASIKVRERSETGALVREWTTEAKLTTSFAPISVSAVAVGDGHTLDVRLSQANAVSGDAMYVDAVSILSPAGTGKSAPPRPVTVTVGVSPASANVTVGEALSFTGATTNTTAGVTWSVDGVTGGNATVGTISASGLYTAPAAVPPAGTVKIRATSVAEPTAFGAATVTVVGFSAAPPPSIGGFAAKDRPYDPGFAFYQRIPSGVSSDGRSGAIVNRFDSNTEASKVIVGAGGEVPTVYDVRSSDPFYSVTVGGKATRFRVPANVVNGGGADGPLVLLDANHPDWGAYTELRLWQARVNASTKVLTASGSGLFHYNNDGGILNPNGSRSYAQPFLGAGTGSGMSIMAGLIRPEEVSRGSIDHALRFTYSNCDSSSNYRAPATRTDQPNGCSTRDPASAMDMGMRLQLDPAVDCNARTVPGKSGSGTETRYLRMICHALQDYGMIVTDGTGPSGILFQMESRSTANWTSLVGNELYGSYGYIVRDQGSPSDGLSRDASSGIPWNRLRVLSRSVF